ncbi:Uma2 family endonuclease [Kitasatospora sp. NPDC059646]|uniref:Uma2 family endonuclease n=1 Tax=Kitasatospora sp. NPDC059646 TaxID=3346893 RepID=UPI0036D1BB45
MPRGHRSHRPRPATRRRPARPEDRRGGHHAHVPALGARGRRGGAPPARAGARRPRPGVGLSGNPDPPGSENWYAPDLAPADLAEKTEGALVPDRTLLIVEVTSPSNADTDRAVERRRHGQTGAPLRLLVDRQDRACTLSSEPGRLGCAVPDGPHPFGAPVRLPEPFDVVRETDRL